MFHTWLRNAIRCKTFFKFGIQKATANGSILKHVRYIYIPINLRISQLQVVKHNRSISYDHDEITFETREKVYSPILIWILFS